MFLGELHQVNDGAITKKVFMNLKSNPHFVLLLFLTVALHILALFLFGPAKPMDNDAKYFLALAESVAAGEGYVNHHSYWPDEPAMDRSPGWPLVVSGFLACLKGLDSSLVMRLTNMCINSANALLLFLLTLHLTKRNLCALFAGLLYSLHPVGLYVVLSGLSEPLFIFFMLLGFLVITQREPAWSVASLLFGFACLVKPNFLVFIAPLSCLMYIGRRQSRKVPSLYIKIILISLFFFLPASFWMYRNYTVSGDFPVMSTLMGLTLYGGNNQVVMEDRDYWGYWVYPNEIPGEPTVRSLSESMSDAALNKHYQKKGVQFMTEHKKDMPFLCLGKLVRAYVPIPWTRSLETLGVSAYRWMLILLVCLGLKPAIQLTPFIYRAGVIGVIFSNMFTVLLFYGSMRFAFSMEPVLMPIAALGLCRVFRCV